MFPHVAETSAISIGKSKRPDVKVKAQGDENYLYSVLTVSEHLTSLVTRNLFWKQDLTLVVKNDSFENTFTNGPLLVTLAPNLLTKPWEKMDLRLNVCRITKGTHIDHMDEKLGQFHVWFVVK